AAVGTGPAAAGVRTGAHARLGIARAEPRAAFARGHFCAYHPARPRGGDALMRAYLTLVRRELGGFFVSLTGYVIIASVLLLLGFSFAGLLFSRDNDPPGVAARLTEVFHWAIYVWR